MARGMTSLSTRTFSVFAGLAALVTAACSTATAPDATSDAPEATGTTESDLTAFEVSTHLQIIRGYYRDALEREPGDAEVAYWEGVARTQGYLPVARAILGSNEARVAYVRGMYSSFLGRAADPGGAAGFINEPHMVAGDPRPGIAAMLSTAEYYVRNGNSPGGYVIGLYRDLLGRYPGAPEVNYWAPLAAANRMNVANAFMGTDEFRARTVVAWYQKWLKRTPSPVETNAWVANLRAGMNWREAQANFMSGFEYTNLHTCRPTSCAAQGKNCGMLADGCGGVQNCGGCSGINSCGGAGVANVCGNTCRPTSCAAQGKNCGVISDGCGGALNCGDSCRPGTTCGGAGVANVCGTTCRPSRTCLDVLADCGTIDDGCGNPLDCGVCDPDQTCGGGGLPNVCGGGVITPLPGGGFPGGVTPIH